MVPIALHHFDGTELDGEIVDILHDNTDDLVSVDVQVNGFLMVELALVGNKLYFTDGEVRTIGFQKVRLIF